MSGYYDSYDDQYTKDYGGTTSAAPMSSPGAALGSYFKHVATRASKPINHIDEAIASVSGRRESMGGTSGGGGGGPLGGGSAVGSFQPAGAPTRFNLDLLGEGGDNNPIMGIAGSPVGQFALGTPGAQRGGAIDAGPFDIATAPVNMMNFATYAREGSLSAITSALGHHYQQGADGQPAGPQNTDDIFQNMSQGDFGNVLDNVIDGVTAAGSVVQAPFDAWSQFMRTNAANSRGQAMRDLIRTGGTIGDPVMRLTANFDQSKFSWGGIAEKAAKRGISTGDMAAELWDLNPAVVDAIANKPDMTDEELQQLVANEPYSYNPAVNLIAELGINLAPMLAGGYALGAASTALRGSALLGGRIAQFLKAGETIGDVGAYIGRPVAMAEKIGSWSMQKAWRLATSKPIRVAGAVTGVTPTGIKIGAGIRFGEWAIKQAATIAGNADAVHMMDEWLWEMPLSNSPGLNLVDAFSVHPMHGIKTVAGAVRHPGRTAGAVGGALEDFAVRVAGKSGVIELDKPTRRNIGAIANMDIATVHARIGAKLDWELPQLERMFSPDSPSGLTVKDLLNGLYHIAREVVRDDNATLAKRLEIGGSVIERDEAFHHAYGPEAVKILRDELEGRGTRISDAIRNEFWHRANIIDASEAGAEGGIGPYIGGIALERLYGWTRASKQFRGIADEALVPALRNDVNTEFLQSARADIVSRYKPNEAISAADLNKIQTYIPSSVFDESGLLRGRARTPRVSRKQMVAILDRLEHGQSRVDELRAGPRTAPTPVIAPADVGSPKATALAFRLHPATIETLDRAVAEGFDALGPVPRELERGIMDRFPGVQEAHIRADPGAYWPEVVEWYGRMQESAVARGEAIAAIDHFSRHLDARTSEGAADAEAIGRIKASIGHPYDAAEIKANPMLAKVVEERDVALTGFIDRMSAWLDSPLRKMKVRQLPDGARIMLETDGFGPGDVALLEDAIARYTKSDVALSPLVDATILSPELHPLEKVEALRAAVDAGLKLPGAQATRLLELGDLTSTYGAIVEQAYPGSPVTKAVIDKLTNEVAGSADELTGLRAEARSLAGLVDRMPSQAISDELSTFRERARTELGTTAVGPGKVEIPHWHNLPIEPAGVDAAASTLRRAEIIRTAERDVASKAAVFETLDRLATRATGLVGKKLETADYLWDEANPIGSHATKKLALEQARELQAAGIATRITKVGSRFKVVRGELTPEAIARKAEEIARAALEREVMDARAKMATEAAHVEAPVEGGTPVSETAQQAATPPETAPAAPEAPAAARERARIGVGPGGPYTQGVEGSTYHSLTADAPTAEIAAARLAHYNEATGWLLRDAQDRGLGTSGKVAGYQREPAGPIPEWLLDPSTADHPEWVVNWLRQFEEARLAAIERSGAVQMKYRHNEKLYSTKAEYKAAEADKVSAERQIRNMLEPTIRSREAEPPPPPIVEQIGEQAAAEAGVKAAFDAAEAERQAAFRAHADRYEQTRAVPVRETAPAPVEAAPTPKPVAINATEIREFETLIAKSVQHADAEATRYRATAEQRTFDALNKQRAAVTDSTDPAHVAKLDRDLKKAMERLAERQNTDKATEWFANATVLRGINHGIETGRWSAELTAAVVRKTPDELKALMARIIAETENGVTIGNVSEWFNAHYDEVVGRATEPVQQGFGEAGAAATTPRLTPAPVEVTFPDPADLRKPVRSRVVLVDAGDILTSDQIGFPANLQPRARAIRGGSNAQIDEIARNLDSVDLTSTTLGRDGMPIVTPEGAVLAGNGRTGAIRIADNATYNRYRAKLVDEGPKYGFDPAVIEGMDRPMLVRELVDVDPLEQTRLAWQLNTMPIGDLAPSLASAITREDIRLLKIGDEQTLVDAIASPANGAAVGRILDHLPQLDRQIYVDPVSGVKADGVRLVEGAILSKLLRADDRTLPTFEQARAVVFDAVEQGGEDMTRITNGLAEAAGQLIKAQERAEAGVIGPEILRFSDDLVPALGRILELRRSLGEGRTLDMPGVLLSLDNTTMFAEATINPIQTHLASILASSSSAKEIRTFMRAIAKAADGPGENVMSMFEDVKLDYTGVLNDGLSAWNRLREANGKPMRDPFPMENYPYDVSLTPGRPNVDGVSTPPIVQSQPLAPEELAPAIAARTLGEDVHAVAETIDQLPEGVTAAVLDPNEAAFAEQLAGMTPEAARADLADALDTISRFRDVAALKDYHLGLLEEANAGTIRPGDWLVLKVLGGIRRNERGELNGSLLGVPENLSDSAALHLEAALSRTFGERPAGAAVVLKAHPQKPISAEELAADVGPEAPYDPGTPVGDALVNTTGHTITTNENPTVARAVRRAAGVNPDAGGNRALLEFNAPDAAVQAERLSALRQQASAALEAAKERRVAAETDAIPGAADVTSVFADDHTRELWNRLMTSGVDPIAAGIGPEEPRLLSHLDDAVESIDRGFIVDPTTGVGLTPSEAAELRTWLVNVMNGSLETAIQRKTGRKAAAFTARVKPPEDFALADLQDRAKAIMDDVAQHIVRDPNTPPLEGWEGTQYIPSPLPTRSKVAPGEPLTPRLILRDVFADDVIPGLTEELSIGRMETIQRRVDTSRATRVIDHVIGPRPEKIIRARAIENFTAELGKAADVENLPPEGAAQLEKLSARTFEMWRDAIEEAKQGPYQIKRKISQLGPEQMNRVFGRAVVEVYGKTPPPWISAMEGAGMTASKMWRRADNRLRNYIRESDMPLSSKIEALYGRVADLGESPSRFITTWYQTLRFLGDIRWMGLEAIEPAILALSEGGIRPLVEGAALTRPGGALRPKATAPKAPIGIGPEVQKALWNDYAHFASVVSDIPQRGSARMRYLMRTLAQQQRRPFREAVLDMARKEPELVRMIREQGDTADAFVHRLERDWALAEQGTKKFASASEAERAFKPWLDGGFIDEATFRAYVKGRSYTAHPAIEAELNRVVGDPLATALYTRLAAINHDLFHNLTETFFGQADRSNLQRVANHPLAYWPISYQIKATKWLLNFMLDSSFGIDTGASTGLVIQRVWDAQRQRLRDDPEYRARLVANKTLFFLASMLLPITPTDLGVSLSPFTRMALDENYRRKGGLFSWGPFYTAFSLIPNLVAEQNKPGGALEGSPLADRAKQLFPQTITVGGKKPTSTIDAETQRIAGPSPIPQPVAPPDYPRLP